MHQHRMCTQNACLYEIDHYCNVMPLHIIPHTHTLDDVSFVLVYIYIQYNICISRYMSIHRNKPVQDKNDVLDILVLTT